MIVTGLIAATVAAAEPAVPAQPAAAVTPAAEKKMDCCEKMRKGEGCDCCKDEKAADSAEKGQSHQH